MKLTNRKRKLLKARIKAQRKVEKYITTQPLKNYKTPAPLPSKQMKRDFERKNKIESACRRDCRRVPSFGKA
jgi:hypothetical protein